MNLFRDACGALWVAFKWVGITALCLGCMFVLLGVAAMPFVGYATGDWLGMWAGIAVYVAVILQIGYERTTKR